MVSLNELFIDITINAIFIHVYFKSNIIYLDDFTQQDHRCRTERNFSIFIFTQVDQYGMRAIDQNPVKTKHAHDTIR